MVSSNVANGQSCRHNIAVSQYTGSQDSLVGNGKTIKKYVDLQVKHVKIYTHMFNIACKSQHDSVILPDLTRTTNAIKANTNF